MESSRAPQNGQDDQVIPRRGDDGDQAQGWPCPSILFTKIWPASHDRTEKILRDGTFRLLSRIIWKKEQI